MTRVLKIALLALLLGACTTAAPTLSSAPTITPLPTPTPTATAQCPTFLEQQYFDALATEMETLLPAIEEIIDFLGQVEDNPLLFLDDKWPDTVAATFIRIEFDAATILELKAPDSVSSVSTLAVEMASSLRAASSAYTIGLFSLNPLVPEATENRRIQFAVEAIKSGRTQFALAVSKSQQMANALVTFCA